MNSVSERTPVGLAEPGQEAPARTLLADLTELVKMRLTLLVLMATFVGFLFGWRGNLDWLYLFHTLCGTFLAAAGAAALNQVFEAEYDLRMRRTKNRPIPAQRDADQQNTNAIKELDIPWAIDGILEYVPSRETMFSGRYS